MHIAINALLVYGTFSGVQHAILHQIRTLLNRKTSHRFTIIALNDVPIEQHIGPTQTEYTVLRAPIRSGERIKRVIWEQWSLPDELVKAQVDLLYAPGYLTSLRWDGPTVVFIHDTIALSHPHLCKRSNALNYRLLLPPSARKADCVAVPSHASAQDVERFCHVPAENIAVVPLGVEAPPALFETDLLAARKKIGVDEPYLLAVSAIEPKKNFGNLIRWFDTWKDAGIPQHLVIVGAWGWKYGEVLRALEHSRYRMQIHMPGYVPQANLPAVMAAADMLLMPSRYEGFGLPALEAMAVGTPVVVSDQGALPETVGEAGLVVPLEDCLWQAEIPTLLRHPDRLQTMRQTGKQWAREHTWKRTGDQLMHIFEVAGNQTQSS
ncbi:MAG TPA: glycosyltransferase family 1 protein [Armatimonadota bacterium]|nr:glycosyltransferase family 1 protein [Armatimonadota bacterium]